MNYEAKFSKFCLTKEMQNLYGMNAIRTAEFGKHIDALQTETIVLREQQTNEKGNGAENGKLE